MPHVQGAGSQPQQSRSANTRMSHQKSPATAAAAPNFHRVRIPKNVLLPGSLLYTMHKNSGPAVISSLTLTYLYVHHQLTALLLHM